jgi:hypothetical protein
MNAEMDWWITGLMAALMKTLVANEVSPLIHKFTNPFIHVFLLFPRNLGLPFLKEQVKRS